MASLIYNEEKKVLSDSTYQKKEYSILEKEARQIAIENFSKSTINYKLLDREYFFEYYINANLKQFDYHSDYLRPFRLAKLNENSTGKLEGIGVLFGSKNGFIYFNAITVGGPVHKSNKIEVGDILLKVGQNNEEPVDVVGFKLFDLAKLTKGPKGSFVNLTIKKADGSIKEVKLKRDVIEHFETYAKSCLIEKNGKQFGIISLTKFYTDYEDEKGRNCYDYVVAEIEKLNKSNISGIILDLRNNGGGDVDKAIELASMFVPKGPIVQLESNNIVTVLNSVTPKINYTGPLLVLVNNESASASEIFAAAIQDYNRGLIIGSAQTYGKGSVQNIMELDKFNPNKVIKTNYGGLKTTVLKYFRINGKSTQNIGVNSSIILPDDTNILSNNEINNTILNATINSQYFETFLPRDFFNETIEKSKKRIENNKMLILKNKEINFLKTNRDNNFLDLESYLNFENEKQEKLNEFSALKKYKNNLQINLTSTDLNFIKKDKVMYDKRLNWIKKLNSDIILDEILEIAFDVSNLATINNKISQK